MSHRLSRRRIAAALGGFVVFLAVPLTRVQAHAILVESTPAVNATVTGPNVPFSLRFNSRIDKARSRLTLIAADKTQTVPPIGSEGTEDVLTTTLADLKAGKYVLRWQVLAIDGHITRGDVPFQVAGE